MSNIEFYNSLNKEDKEKMEKTSWYACYTVVELFELISNCVKNEVINLAFKYKKLFFKIFKCK